MFPTYENNHENFLIYFFKIGHHVLYPLIKFELKIQFVRGEQKRKIAFGVDCTNWNCWGSKLSLNFSQGIKRTK
jgi:hypothetical protein